MQKSDRILSAEDISFTFCEDKGIHRIINCFIQQKYLISNKVLSIGSKANIY